MYPKDSRAYISTLSTLESLLFVDTSLFISRMDWQFFYAQQIKERAGIECYDTEFLKDGKKIEIKKPC